MPTRTPGSTTGSYLNQVAAASFAAAAGRCGPRPTGGRDGLRRSGDGAEVSFSFADRGAGERDDEDVDVFGEALDDVVALRQARPLKKKSPGYSVCNTRRTCVTHKSLSN